jgi:hypothetical protein
MASRNTLQLQESEMATQRSARKALSAIADTMRQSVNVCMNARRRNAGIVDVPLLEAKRQELL